MLKFAFRPDPQDAALVYPQREFYLRALIDAGRITPGEKLPASRELSNQILRDCVALAFLNQSPDEIDTGIAAFAPWVARRAGARSVLRTMGRAEQGCSLMVRPNP